MSGYQQSTGTAQSEILPILSIRAANYILNIGGIS